MLVFSTMCVVVDLVGAVSAVFLLAIMYEGLKTLREYLVYRDWKHWNSHKPASKKRCIPSVAGGSMDSLDNDDDDDELRSSGRALIMNGKTGHSIDQHRVPSKGEGQGPQQRRVRVTAKGKANGHRATAAKGEGHSKG